MKDRKKILHFLMICATLCLTGCFSIDYARVPQSQNAHLLVGNYGWYLFHWIPLACGNASKYPLFPCVFFRNDVTLEKIQHRFMEKAEALGKTNEYELTYNTHDSVLLEIPGLNFPLPIPYFITYREIQLSGVLEKEKGVAK